MRLSRDLIQDIVFSQGSGSRFTQDSPIMPDVWIGYATGETGVLDLLLEPHRKVAPGELATRLRQSMTTGDSGLLPGEGSISSTDSYVVGRVHFDRLVRVLLPLSGWWHSHPGHLADLTEEEIIAAASGNCPQVTSMGQWFLRVVGSIAWARSQSRERRIDEPPSAEDYAMILAKLLKGVPQPSRCKPKTYLWSINRNREARPAIWTSSRTMKSDVARSMFKLDCSRLTWAILDSGVDATHPAFRMRNADGQLGRESTIKTKLKKSRVMATYDFTRIRRLLAEDADELPETLGTTSRRRAAELRRRIQSGQSVDWELLEPMLRIEAEDYSPPGHPHGTHVAGILAADWRRSDKGFSAHKEHDMQGVCPDIRIFDLRVLDADGTGDEFSILAALQFVRYLNSRNRVPVIQGVNLSLSIPHDVSNFACGRTPVCEESERLVGSGIVVVVAAGNRGHTRYLTSRGDAEAYQNISITDPGNAERVITVGATHRARPHTYGISYFSSRGPTGDGRLKPDLVAPGEKITATTPMSGFESMDGTSMAAPHVSGAAALIMSRHPEFIGDPDRIKKILCSTCTDLGRERYFQGAGLVDICRAIQSI